jgi:hypothetical protein
MLLRGQRPCPEVSSIIDDVEEVDRSATILALLVVLSYLSMHIIVSQASLADGFLTEGSP